MSLHMSYTCPPLGAERRPRLVFTYKLFAETSYSIELLDINLP